MARQFQPRIPTPRSSRWRPDPVTRSAWTDYIHGDPAILAGKPVVKGTRLPVDFILERFGNGWAQRGPEIPPAAFA